MGFDISIRWKVWVPILVLLSINCNGLKAQGNLQFSQVYTFGDQFISTGPFATYLYTPEYIVPPNKVWKIEARTLGTGGSVFQFLINEKSVEGVSDCVIWLKQGDTIKYRKYPSYNNVNDVFLSIVEFNIVP